MSDDSRVTGTLDDWTSCEWLNGLQLEELGELESLSVRTQNSNYEIVVTSPASGDVLVRGGSRFPTFIPARVCGSTRGGSLLKRTGIYPGLRLELSLNARRILTATILSVIRSHRRDHAANPVQ